MSDKPVILVLGASGMLGNVMLRYLATCPEYSVVGSIRSISSRGLFPDNLHHRLICGVNAEKSDDLLNLFASVQPSVVINCIGVIKQLADASDPLTIIPINALLPHRLSQLCKLAGAKLIHISTDCVFSGTKGMYREDDKSDAEDLYGRSKLLGEVSDPDVTLRTSIIGPELGSAHGLVGWFLAQRGRVKGFTRAIFSGVPTVELARIVRNFVIPNKNLQGLYHVSADPISKYELLLLIRHTYEIAIDIEPAPEPVIDRSLDSSKFRDVTGYSPSAWPDLIRNMREFSENADSITP